MLFWNCDSIQPFENIVKRYWYEFILKCYFDEGEMSTMKEVATLSMVRNIERVNTVSYHVLMFCMHLHGRLQRLLPLNLILLP